jgi:hypothetical protein
MKYIKNNSKASGLMKVSYLVEHSSHDEVVLFMDKNIKSSLHSYDCEPDLFKYLPEVINGHKIDLLKSLSSYTVYITLKSLSIVTGSKSSNLFRRLKGTKHMIHKGSGGRPAKVKSVSHVNNNLVDFQYARKLITEYTDRQAKRLAKHGYRSFK